MRLTDIFFSYCKSSEKIVPLPPVMRHSSELIILNYTKVREKSLVLHALTPEWGRRSFICSVPKGGAMALLQTLNIVDGEVVENPKSELWRVSSLHAVHPLNGIRTNVYKNSMTMFIGEVLFRALREENSAEPELFEWCRKSILTLDALQSDFSNYHLLFLLEFASVLGFMPDRESLAPFAGEYAEQIDALLSSGREEALLLPLSGAQRNEIASRLLEYLGRHCEISLNVKSLKVLRELYR